MSIASGDYTFGAESGRLMIETSRTGLGAKAGHDLTIEVTRWYGEATIDATDPAASSVNVEADAGSFEVRKGTGGVKPLTSSDRGEIEKIIREKILHTTRNATITFHSTRVAGTAESFRVEGTLTIAGVTRPITVQCASAEGRVRGSTSITQSRWGIRPYSAFFGALKLNDEVEVWFDVELVPKN
ncbi:YceI family protein [Thermopolyspora sp. NPDC052614]|uniref:YceI family protein n=1 Tax=Thermopolyspora sp. NPDC052614 TaxID=3155682 RepID=UPI00341713AB